VFAFTFFGPAAGPPPGFVADFPNIAKSDYNVVMYVDMGQLGSHWTGFDEI
jgi:hypothetical protein